MTPAVANIVAWRETATDDDVAAGRDWYPFARQAVADYSRDYGVTPDVAAGVIAVLSPRCEWMDNLHAAAVVLRAHANGEPMPRPDDVPGVLLNNLRKAWAIVQHGADFPRCCGSREGKRGGMVKCNGRSSGCPAGDYLHGPKVSEFHATILGKLDGRVVDVWATRAADVSPYEALTIARDDPRCSGDPGSRFAQLQDAYAHAADIVGEDARTLQAIVWTRIRRTWRKPGGALQVEIPF